MCDRVAPYMAEKAQRYIHQSVDYANNNVLREDGKALLLGDSALPQINLDPVAINRHNHSTVLKLTDRYPCPIVQSAFGHTFRPTNVERWEFCSTTLHLHPLKDSQ